MKGSPKAWFFQEGTRPLSPIHASDDDADKSSEEDTPRLTRTLSQAISAAKAPAAEDALASVSSSVRHRADAAASGDGTYSASPSPASASKALRAAVMERSPSGSVSGDDSSRASSPIQMGSKSKF
jgi:hypothetical protein